MKKLKILLQKLEEYIAKSEHLNAEISSSSVGWHIEHSLMTIDAITHNLKKSNPAEYKSSMVFSKILIFAMGKIPRGRAIAPEIVKPKNDITVLTLNDHLERTKLNISMLKDINKNCFFEHPYFKKLNVQKSIRFMEIHTNHHLNVVRDIINK